MVFCSLDPLFADEEQACIFINSETHMVNENYTYSFPTRAAVLGLMKLAGFEIRAARKMDKPDRITVLGRATALDTIPDRTALLQRIREMDACDFEFRYAKLVPAPVASTVSYTGPRDEAAIDYRSYKPDFPFHPPPEGEAVGTTEWASPSGNH